ncbi:glycosyltransferase family 4 protein [Pelotalea chapellei]|uniref:Glycosyltransferase family 4 protein n=1 Tax=Pelotalea chapellei TaxID=44671 RepID=A0ABS5U5E1_9BACT|nr:glycosyltransferase family 4 protein [Pelotalea chapellei]MBT1070888.1 glycosyltransferase family 4 protein [Pelotalea chapellei]
MSLKKASIAVLDMWASNQQTQGPSKHWLYNQLSSQFDVQIVRLPRWSLHDVLLLASTVSYTRYRWGTRFYTAQEKYGRTPRAFIKRTRLFQKALDDLPRNPDVILQIGAMFGPLDVKGVPYLSYHDQTMAMVEAHCTDWLPDNFETIKNDWYRLERDFYNAVTQVVTYSNVTKGSMVNDYGVRPANVSVIPTACKLPFPNSEEALLPRKRQLLFVSTDFKLKGGDLLLEAFPLIKENVPNIELIIAGGKLPPGVVLSDPAIHYVGSLSAQELQRYYLTSELLVHPARYDAFPNVLKEAIACGLPVVASDLCGMPEILDQGKNGILIKNLTSASFAQAVIRLLRDKPHYQQLQQQCLLARDRYQPAIVGQQFITLINSCLGVKC